MNLTFTDIKSKLHKDSVVEFTTCYVGGYKYNEKIETKIRQIKDSLEKTVQNERLSVSQWNGKLFRQLLQIQFLALTTSLVFVRI